MCCIPFAEDTRSPDRGLCRISGRVLEGWLACVQTLLRGYSQVKREEGFAGLSAGPNNAAERAIRQAVLWLPGPANRSTR
jgi:hypothetical protein